MNAFYPQKERVIDTCGNMDGSQKQAQKNIWFHLRKVQEQEKLIYCDGCQIRAYFSGDVDWKMACKGWKWNVLSLDLGYGVITFIYIFEIIELHF